MTEIQTDRGDALPLRRRKVAVAHHSDDIVMQIDPNGNTRTYTRLSSLTESPRNSLGENETPTVTKITEDNDTISRDSRLWENSVLQQIQSLIQNVQVSDSLTDCINRELLNNDINNELNANVGPFGRRKSCFSLTNNGHIQTTRRQSVTAIHQQKSQSLPRQSISNAVNANFKTFTLPCSRRSSVTNMNRRRPSFAGSRRQSVSSRPASRRSSIAYTHNGGGSSITRQESRRNSAAHCILRRGSLAHAYQNSAFQPIRRKSVFSYDNTVSGSSNTAIVRRNSSVKPPQCFPVTKIASVQKRINKIYRRRRRQDRAEVKMADVRKAFKANNKENVTDSDSQGRDSGNVSKHDSENETVDENSNICADNENHVGEVNACSEKIDINDTVVDKLEDANVDNPTPRRKTSIQVRAWELSRRLRQRRREKRKGFTESPLI